MRCSECKEELSAYLDNELDEISMIAFENHLNQCADCAAEKERLIQVSAALRTTPVPELKTDIFALIKPTLVEMIQPKPLRSY